MLFRSGKFENRLLGPTNFFKQMQPSFEQPKNGCGQLTAGTHPNIVAVALANKLARMAWAVLAKNETYRPPVLVGV